MIMCEQHPDYRGFRCRSPDGVERCFLCYLETVYEMRRLLVVRPNYVRERERIEAEDLRRALLRDSSQASESGRVAVNTNLAYIDALVTAK